MSMCCMVGAKENPLTFGSAPMTRTQWDVMIVAVAALARRYQIPVTPTTILTHAEVQPNLGIRQENKWDITQLAFDSSISGHEAVGKRMRREITAALGGVPVGDAESDVDEVTGVVVFTESLEARWLFVGGQRRLLMSPDEIRELEAERLLTMPEVRLSPAALDAIPIMAGSARP